MIDVIALVWLLLNWLCYSHFAKYMAKRTHCLASVMQLYRKDWLTRLLTRSQRVADVAVIANLERSVAFFASTAILILAGLLTVITTFQGTFLSLTQLPFLAQSTPLQMWLKVIVLVGIYVYTFFSMTWSLRQYSFASVLFGAAPMPEDESVSEEERQAFARYAAKIIDQAGHSFNFGLRSFYFSIAVMFGFVDPRLMMVASSAVVAVLYMREFRSSTLNALLEGRLVSRDISRS